MGPLKLIGSISLVLGFAASVATVAIYLDDVTDEQEAVGKKLDAMIVVEANGAQAVINRMDDMRDELGRKIERLENLHLRADGTPAEEALARARISQPAPDGG